MSAPLWRVVILSNEAHYYGNDDGTMRGSLEYGLEATVRREYDALVKAGWEVRLERRDSEESPWRTVQSHKPIRGLKHEDFLSERQAEKSQGSLFI